MSKFSALILLPLLLSTADAGTAYPFTLGDPPPRIIKIDESQKLIIAKDGNVKGEIVVADDASPVTKLAAEELQHFLKESLGKTLPIISAPTGKVPAFILGDNEFSRKEGIDISRIPQEGFVIKTSGDRIFIVGPDEKNIDLRTAVKSAALARQYFQRGTLTGVYDFLERFVGVRFYFPGEMGTVVPRLTKLELPAIDIIERPDNVQRMISFWAGEWIPGEKKDSRALNIYRLRLETKMIPFGHGLSRFNLMERFGKSNPEYFTLLSNGKRYNDPSMQHPGQLCFSSDVFEVIKADVKAFLTGETAASRGIKPEQWSDSKGWSIWSFQPGQVGLNPQDGFNFCTCPKCRPIFEKGNKAASTLVWSRITEVARYLQKEKIPGLVNGMAYHFFTEIPDCEISENMCISVAAVGPWADHLSEPRNSQDKLINDWYEKAKRKVLLRNYALNGGASSIEPAVPAMSPKAIGNFYKNHSPQMAGAYLECFTEKYLFFYLNYYIFSRVLWDSSADIDSLIQEHHRKMFGAAAGPIGRFYERLENLWLGKVIGRTFDTPRGPQVARASLYDLWEKIYTQEEIASMEKLFEEAETLAANEQPALKRIRFIKSQFLDSIKEGSKAYFLNKREIADWKIHAYDLKQDEKITMDINADSPIWAKAPSEDLLPFQSPTQEVRTTIKAARDSDNLYLMFDCEEPFSDSDTVSDRNYDDKETYRDSGVEIFLNPSGDRINYYQIMINAKASISDLSAKKIGAEQVVDWNWNSGAEARCLNDKKRYLLEVKIPLKNMGQVKNDSFPSNFTRSRKVSEKEIKTKRYSWSPFLKESFHDLEHFGNIDFTGKDSANILDNSSFTDPVNGRDFGRYRASRPEGNKLVAPQEQAVTIDKTTFMKNGQSVKLTANGETIFLRQQLPALKPDTNYRLSAYIKIKDIVPSANGGGACFNIWDDINHYYPVSGTYTGSMPWTRQVFFFKTSSITNKKTAAYFNLILKKCQGSAWFDDVRLEEINSK